MLVELNLTCNNPEVLNVVQKLDTVNSDAGASVEVKHMSKSKKQKTKQKKHKAKNIEGGGDSDVVLNNSFSLLESENALDGEANVSTFNNIGSSTGPVAQLTTKVVDKGSQDMNASKLKQGNIQVNTSAKSSLRPVAGKDSTFDPKTLDFASKANVVAANDFPEVGACSAFVVESNSAQHLNHDAAMINSTSALMVVQADNTDLGYEGANKDKFQTKSFGTLVL